MKTSTPEVKKFISRRSKSSYTIIDGLRKAAKNIAAQTAWSIRQKVKRKEKKRQLDQFTNFRDKVKENKTLFCDACNEKFGVYVKQLEDEIGLYEILEKRIKEEKGKVTQLEKDLECKTKLIQQQQNQLNLQQQKIEREKGKEIEKESESGKDIKKEIKKDNEIKKGKEIEMEKEIIKVIAIERGKDFKKGKDFTKGNEKGENVKKENECNGEKEIIWRCQPNPIPPTFSKKKEEKVHKAQITVLNNHEMVIEEKKANPLQQPKYFLNITNPSQLFNLPIPTSNLSGEVTQQLPHHTQQQPSHNVLLEPQQDINSEENDSEEVEYEDDDSLEEYAGFLGWFDKIGYKHTNCERSLYIDWKKDKQELISRPLPNDTWPSNGDVNNSSRDNENDNEIDNSDNEKDIYDNETDNDNEFSWEKSPKAETPSKKIPKSLTSYSSDSDEHPKLWEKYSIYNSIKQIRKMGKSKHKQKE